MKKLSAVLLAITLLLCSCAGTAESSQQTQSSISSQQTATKTVKVGGLQGPTALSLLKMWDDGSDIDGYTAEYELLAAPDAMVAALSKGEYDFAFLPLNTAANLFNKNTDYRLAGISAWGNMYIIGTDTEVSSVESLKGKTVAVSGQGATPDVLIRYYLSQKRLTKNVTLDYTLAAHADLAASVISGKTAIALMPEPFVSNILAKNSNVKILVDMQQVWAEVTGGEALIPQSALVVKGSFADANPDAVADFVKLQRSSAAYCNTDTAAMADLAEKHGVTLPRVAILNGTTRCNINFLSTSEAREKIDAYLNTILGFSKADIGGAMPAETFFLTTEK